MINTSRRDAFAPKLTVTRVGEKVARIARPLFVSTVEVGFCYVSPQLCNLLSLGFRREYPVAHF